jgi:F-type H+-transporting ATPase subunit c
MKIVRNLVAKLPVMASFAAGALAPVATAVAEDTQGGAASSLGPVGAGLAIGVAVLGGALGQGKVVGSMLESFGRNPSVGGKLLTPMMIGMVLIEQVIPKGGLVLIRHSPLFHAQKSPSYPQVLNCF